MSFLNTSPIKLFGGGREPANQSTEAMTELPSLPTGSYFSPSMTLSNLNGSSPDLSNFSNETNPALTPTKSTSRPPGPGEHTPTRQSRSALPNSDSILSFPNLGLSIVDLNDTPSPLVATGDNNDAWSSAVGRATNTGKSGRVIEKLTGDLERSLREKRLLAAKAEEEAKRSESARSIAESLQTKNANLTSIYEANLKALDRKDRKIEELKVDLEAEKARREEAETQTKEVTKERDEVVAVYRKESVEDKETVRKLSSQYEAISSSWHILTDGYRRQIQKIQDDIDGLHKRHLEDQTRFEQLALISTHVNRGQETMKAASENMVGQLEEYKQEQEASIRAIKDRAEKYNTANDTALLELKTVKDEMNYLINVKKNVPGAA
ncbi:hypothetical protein MMC19_004432 [Ptychographa xylographoides]|nr:hypothetical protein [Ptychographa xylographoides]